MKIATTMSMDLGNLTGTLIFLAAVVVQIRIAPLINCSIVSRLSPSRRLTPRLLISPTAR
ncbi:hypothetical protein BN132_3201 [Cronobacter turicensis 564]|nr:hypothetical protein BN132_3201 [Cronobacter turicensis 564]